MINLIPPQAKKSLLKEYWVRVFSIWLTLWSVILLLSAVVLLPTYVLIGTQVDVYKNSAEQASQKVAGFQDVSKDLVLASQEARFLVDESLLPDLSDYVTLFEELRGVDIELNKISIMRDGSDMRPASISGLAKDRQSLASFRDRMLADSQIIDVNLPISNLTRDKDINFTITVNLKPIYNNYE